MNTALRNPFMLQEGSFSLPLAFLEMDESGGSERERRKEQEEEEKEEEKERDPSSCRDPSL